MPEVSGVTNGLASGARENNGGADAKCSPPRTFRRDDMARRPRMQGKFSGFNKAFQRKKFLRWNLINLKYEMKSIYKTFCTDVL